MERCEEIRGRVADLAGLQAEGLPPAVRQHLAGCPACARVLAAARVARGLLAAAAAAPEPPAGFAARVLGALPAAPAPRGAEEELWRPAWGLLPAFAAAAAALLFVFQMQVADFAGPAWPDADVMLASVMEENGR